MRIASARCVGAVGIALWSTVAPEAAGQDALKDLKFLITADEHLPDLDPAEPSWQRTNWEEFLRRVRADYERERVVRFEGWYFSRSEARLVTLLDSLLD